MNRPGKRARDTEGPDSPFDHHPPLSYPPSKRPRVHPPQRAPRSPLAGAPPPRDRISPLSDELLLRILSFLPLTHLLAAAPVSHRFARLAADAPLWKALYYARFVLPRALRIPGFRDGAGGGAGAGAGAGHRLHYSGRRTLWADGRRGGVIREKAEWGGQGGHRGGVDWKRQYKIRHNWAKGRCAVEELKMSRGAEGDEEVLGRKMLVKVVEGIAITADEKSGLRAWNLKTRQMLACMSLHESDDEIAVPTCITIDDHAFEGNILDIAVGFLDGSFGIWRLDFGTKELVRRYRHERSSNGELVGVSYSHPYLLTATESVVLSLYTFESRPSVGLPSVKPGGREGSNIGEQGGPKWSLDPSRKDNPTEMPKLSPVDRISLPPPYLLTSLRSHSSRPPLALSIRKLASTTIASIAYTFSTRQGWSIGIQDLHIQPAPTTPSSEQEITSTRLAYTAPFPSGATSTPSTPPRRPAPPSSTSSPQPPSPTAPPPGPTSLCYTHPYLLATLPDNTLLLHLCTSSAAALSIAPGIRLWGHTSGISDAEITARGKAVSVSGRGAEVRVWELEGRGQGGGRSVEVRPERAVGSGEGEGEGEGRGEVVAEWGIDERRNWVGFDDEMILLLKEAKGGRESLLVYDFT